MKNLSKDSSISAMLEILGEYVQYWFKGMKNGGGPNFACSRGLTHSYVLQTFMGDCLLAALCNKTPDL